MAFADVRDEIKQTVKLTHYIGSSRRVDCPHPDCIGKGKKADCQPYDTTWYCFVCKSSGDIFNWVMLTQFCSFAVAVRTLADYAGIPLEPNPERTNLLNRFVSESVRYLEEHPEKLDYIVNTRGIPVDTLREHSVGYCDTEGEVLERTGLTQDQLLNLGLLYNSTTYNGLYNQMGGRYVFPIKDLIGNTVSLKGRANPADHSDLDPRRKSMPIKADGPWGRHSHMDCLYLEEYIKNYKDYVFICEGEPDTLTLRSWGINAVGMMTNTGIIKHAHKLKQFDRIYFALDNDDQTQRHIISELFNLQIKLPNSIIYNVTLPSPDGNKVDVNDYKVKLGYTKQDFHKLATQSPEAAKLIITEWAKHFGKDRNYSAKIYSLIRNLPDRREALLEFLSSITNVPTEMLAFAVDTSN